MKNKMKYFVPILAFSLLTACGSSPSTPTASKPSDNKQTTSNAPDKKEEKTPTDYPKKPVTFIVPFAAGGGTDLIARPLAAATEKHLGQPIKVENKTGGGGAVGMSAGSTAKPDGYTVTMATSEVTFLTHLGLTPLTYKEFKPIAQVTFDPSVVTVQKDAPYNTIQEFLDYAKKNPGKVQVGNAGAGGIWHLAAASIEKAAGVKFNHVPFDGGAPAVTALLGGHIQAVTVSAAEVLEQVKAGKLKPLAVLSDSRIDSMPDVPTFKEAGLNATPLGSWKAIVVPKDTPDDIAKKIADAFMKGAAEEEYKSTMKKAGLNMVVKDAEGLGQLMVKDNDFYSKLIPELGLKK